jgi:catabolite repression HPr-like protein
MITKKMNVKLPSGLAARPIAVLVQIASQFESEIHIECENKKVNAKSIMGMMSLTLTAGEEVTVVAEGNDESKAIEGIEQYLCRQ